MDITRYTADFGGQETPVIAVTGDAPGPRLSVIAGVHGCEYASMAGVRRWVAGLSGLSGLSGRPRRSLTGRAAGALCRWRHWPG